MTFEGTQHEVGIKIFESDAIVSVIKAKLRGINNFISMLGLWELTIALKQ